MDPIHDGELERIMKKKMKSETGNHNNEELQPDCAASRAELIPNVTDCGEGGGVPTHDSRITSTNLLPPQIDSSMYPDDKSGGGGVVYQLFYSAHNAPANQVYHMSPAPPMHTPRVDDPALQSMQTVPVSCGNISGKMYLHMFTCPGIHQPCIEYESHILSPKQFTIQGEKERQKDWKASIRIGKSSLRAHMEAGTFDFYDHANRCSGKCQSRNYVNAPMDRAEVILMRKAKRNADQVYLRQEIDSEMNGGSLNESNNPENDGGNERRDTSVPIPGRKARGRPRGSSNKQRTVKKEDLPTENYFDYFDGNEQTEQVENENNEKAEDCSPFFEVLNCLQYDPHHFWTQMQNTGVISHFCDDIIVHAINLKQSSLGSNHMTSQTANMLTRVSFALGIQSLIVHRVQNIERSVYQRRKHEEMLQEMAKKNGDVEENEETVHTTIEYDSGRQDFNVMSLEDANEFLVPNDNYIKEVKFEEENANAKNREELQFQEQENFKGDTDFIENSDHNSPFNE